MNARTVVSNDESRKIERCISQIRAVPVRDEGVVLRGDVATHHGIVVFMSDLRKGKGSTLMKFAYSGRLYERKCSTGLSQLQIPKAARAFASDVVSGEVR